MRQVAALVFLFEFLLVRTVAADFALLATTKHDGKEVSVFQLCTLPVGETLKARFAVREFTCFDHEKARVAASAVTVLARTSGRLLGMPTDPLSFECHNSTVVFPVITLSSTAILDFAAIAPSLDSDESISLVLGGSRTSAPAVWPVSDARITVPAEVTVVPVLLRAGLPIAVSTPVALRAGETRMITSFERGNSMLLSITVADPFSRKPPAVFDPVCRRPYADASLRILQVEKPPSVVFIDGAGSIHTSAVVPFTTAQTRTAVYVFRDLPAGSGSIRIASGHWEATTYPINVKPGVNAVEDPFVAFLGGSVEVEAAGVVRKTLEGSTNRCSDKPLASEPGRESGISLERVPSESVVSGSSAFATKPVSADGSYVFEGIRPSEVRVVARASEVVLASEVATIAPGQTRRLTLENTEAFYLFGRVSRDGKPFTGTLRFRTGEAVTSPSGEYVAVLKSAPGLGVVNVVACDESMAYQYRPATDLFPGSTLDIEIPMNDVEIEVRDARTGNWITKGVLAIVGTLQSKDDPDHASFNTPGELDGDLFIARNLEAGRPFRICAQAPGYRSYCAPEVFEKKRGSERHSIDLQPAGDRTGKVLSPGYRFLFFTTTDGTITERVQIEDDGTFRYQAEHGIEEFIALVGDSPLYLGRVPPPSDAGELLLEVPSGKAIAFTVKLNESSTRRNAIVGLWLNGVRVPQEAFLNHQMIRRDRSMIIQRIPIVIRDLCCGNPSVAAGPDPELLPKGTDLSSASMFTGARLVPISNGEAILD